MLEQQEILAPYPGLRPFEAHETAIFFGRESHVSRLLEILRRERFLAVIGPSGCGKSSLVRADMLPALATGWGGGGTDWRIAIMRPGDRPMRSLAKALLTPAALGGELDESSLQASTQSEAMENAAALLEAELRRGPLGLVEIEGDAQRIAAEAGAAQPFNLLVLVDQFEELFRYSEASAEQADESEAFVNLILEPRRHAACRVYVALAMRSDFLGNCTRFFDLPEAINRAQYLTPRLSREQLAAAIQEPARVFGGSIARELVTALINSVFRDPDQLPILQHALARMWERAAARDSRHPHIRAEDLTAIGGIDNALSEHADQVLGTLGPAEQRLAEALFRAITDRGTIESGGRDTRRPQTVASIAAEAGFDAHDWQRFVPVIDAFSREGVNFLTCVRPLEANTRIDISHEALIRQWKSLQEWVAEEADRARRYARWRDRSMERDGELLSGADLAAALQWRGTEASAEGWRPHAAWARRYAASRDDAVARAEFDGVLTYIAASQARDEQDRRAKEEAQQRELERSRRQTRIARSVAGVALGVVLIAGYVIHSLYWVAKNEIELESFFLLQRFRMGYAPLPTLVSISAGRFDMGERDRAWRDRLDAGDKRFFGKPVDAVEIDAPFQLGETEVTYDQFDYFVWSKQREGADVAYPKGAKGGRGDRPVVDVHLRQVLSYAEWIGTQNGLKCGLPTEAQWEYAARAGMSTAYPWGDQLAVGNAVCKGCGGDWGAGEKSAPVASLRKPNKWGLHDMSGNVWEWTCSAFRNEFDGSERGCADQGDRSARAVRGGSFYYVEDFARSSARVGIFPDGTDVGLGFRVLCASPIAKH